MAANGENAETTAPSDPVTQNEEHVSESHDLADSETADPKNDIKEEDQDQGTTVKLENIPSMSTTGQKRKVVHSTTDAPSNKKSKARKVIIKLKGNRSSGQHMIQSMRGKCSAQSKDSEAPEKALKSNKVSLFQAIKIFGDKVQYADKEPGENNDMFLVKGMTTTLRDYQLTTAAFMLRHERAKTDPHGGIIADQMGVGKTVQSIACILAHPAPAKDVTEGCGCTLIVMPSQPLIKQWMEEFTKHIDEGILKTYDLHHYQGKSHNSAKMLRSADFIFTTFSQVVQCYNSQGPLFQINFYRIILDEADRIKTKNTTTSRACAGLRGKYKWALSGTPIPNRLAEILPYLRFLGINIHEDREHFEQRFEELKNGDTIDSRITAILNTRMTRREKGELFMGRKICKLPDCHDTVLSIPMTHEEFHIYSCIERYIAKALDQDLIQSEPSTGLGLNFHRLNGLRQAVDHPINLFPILKGMPAEETRDLKDQLAIIEGKTGVYEQIYEQVEAYCRKQSGDNSAADSKGQSSQSDETQPLRSDSYFEMSSHLEYVLKSKDNKGCISCFNELAAPNMKELQCKHTLCQHCFDDILKQGEAAGHRSGKCPECGKIFWVFKKKSGDRPDIDLRDIEVDSSILDAINGQNNDGYIYTKTGQKIQGHVPKSSKKPCLGDDFNGFQPTSSSTAQKWLKVCDKKPGKPVVPSAKTTAAINLVLDWQKTAPNDKIIIFVEWTITANVLGRMLQNSQIQFIYYFGELDSKHREKALKTFENNEDIKVMIMGIKCGNLGLNITCANRAICLSLWWNYSNEEQAKGRICRHGQTKETYFVRIVVEKSVDYRMLTLQRHKMQDIEPAMISGKSEKFLTEKEVRWLFGQTQDQYKPSTD